MFGKKIKEIEQHQKELLSLTRELHSVLVEKIELVEKGLSLIRLEADKQGHVNLKLDFILRRLDELENQQKEQQ